MKQIVYYIFNDKDELLYARNYQFDTKQKAIDYIKELYNKLKTNKNVSITAYKNDILKFINLPTNEYEKDEFHTLQII